MRILICDDEVRYINDLQGYIEEYMNKHGINYVVDTTTSPNEITESDAVYDLVFLDIKMPQFDGIDLAYELKERNMTQKQLAAESGIKASVLSETINGKRPVSLSVAVAIEKVLGVPADVWMNMQTQYDLDMANIATRGNESEKVEVIIPIKDRNLLKEIARKFGWACML